MGERLFTFFIESRTNYKVVIQIEYTAVHARNQILPGGVMLRQKLVQYKITLVQSPLMSILIYFKGGDHLF